MARYRAGLPQVGGGVYLTDSGIETVLIFHHGYELPDFAAFVLLDDEVGVETLRNYYRDHAAIARDAGAGFVFESPTWRASPDWGPRLGYTDEALAAANRKAIEMLRLLHGQLRAPHPLRPRLGVRRSVARTHPGDPSQRVSYQPCRARRAMPSSTTVTPRSSACSTSSCE
jgi:hypothetical protein